MTTERYSAVFESGSHSDPQAGKLRWEVRGTCGHVHRTIAAAQQCLDRRQRWFCLHGRRAGTPCRRCLGSAQANSTSADWGISGCIHDQHGHRVEATP